MRFFEILVTCPKGLEYLLEAELKLLGMQVAKISPLGVWGSASLADIYRICLWSRLANRVQLILFSGSVHHEDLFKKLTSGFAWQTVFNPQSSLAISFHGTNEYIRNTMYGAQLLKDAVVDHFRSSMGLRPSINKDQPDVRLHAYLRRDELFVTLDLSGGSLHQRAYRLNAGEAPMKENLAAALLMRSNWPQRAQNGESFYDVCCGSGTIVIEAAMVAANIAPGLLRKTYGFEYWVRHDTALWNRIRQEALESVKPVTQRFYASDQDEYAIEQAKKNAQRAGVMNLIEFHVGDLSQVPAPQAPQGLLMCNPPYGERLGDMVPLMVMYQALGKLLHEKFRGWYAGVLTSNAMLAKSIGLRAEKKYAFYNGAIPCELYLFNLDCSNQFKNTAAPSDSQGLGMIINRLKKNYQHMSKWAKKRQIEALRLYDADLPEYAFALDQYANYFVLQEYLPPKSISPVVAERRRVDMVQAVISALGIDPSHLIVKQRQQQKGAAQYERLREQNQKMSINEGSIKLLVNLYDYLDTGLFLDHRLIRISFESLQSGARFLNLFCYTASASVHAAYASAITTNVDMSKTYLKWAEENFLLNNFALNKHHFIQADVMEWLKESKQTYDVIFLDPPTFSNSKKMKQTLDVQRDHVDLITASMRLLAKNGFLIFSTNLRTFCLDEHILTNYKVINKTVASIDEDFKRDLKIHQCYEIRHA